MKKMPRTKNPEKTKYRTVQIPENLVKLILTIIPGLYRNHHEAIIEWIRLGIYGLVETKYKLKKLKQLKDFNKQQT